VASFIVRVPGGFFCVPIERRLSTLDAAPTGGAGAWPSHAKAGERRAGPTIASPRRRALLVSALVALVLHGAIVGGIGGPAVGTTAELGAAPVSVRTVEPDAKGKAGTIAGDVEPAREPAAPAAGPLPAPGPTARQGRVTKAEEDTHPGPFERLGAHLDEATAVSRGPVAAAPAPVPAAVAAPADPTAVAAAPAESVSAAGVDAPPPMHPAEPGVAPATGSTAAGEAPSPVAAGEAPPPVYATRLPPSATMRYQVRRGVLRGTGEIRWRASGESYQLVLEARVAGLTLLIQTSDGAIDANGLAPRRFLDQRARRPAQAANFRRDIDRITFSGPAVEWPLLPGSQDRLSWMIQLSAIAAATPGRVAEGGRISMLVVGARGEAAVWTMRSAGPEEVETAWGTAHAVRLVRDGHSLYDTHAEIWLDPERDYLPVRATLRNGAGASEYDLLLERVDPAR
jgi:hypothetical protein